MAVRSLIETVKLSETFIQRASCFRIPHSAFRYRLGNYAQQKRLRLAMASTLLNG